MPGWTPFAAISWSCSRRPAINWLALGIEAGNENVRLDIEKGRFQDVNIRDVVRMVEDHGIEVLGNYMFGFPSDTRQTMQQTLDLAMELNTAHANFYPCQALPGSPLYFTAQSEGWELPSSFEEFAFLSYDCKPLPTHHLPPPRCCGSVMRPGIAIFPIRRISLSIGKKFGPEQRRNIEELAAIHLKRRLLGD